MRKRLLSIILGLSLVVTSSISTLGAEKFTKDSKVEITKSTKIENQISRAIRQQGVKEEESSELVELVVLSKGKDVTRELKTLGAKVNKMSTSVYVVTIPAKRAKRISTIKEVQGVIKDKILTLPKPIDKSILYPNGGDIVYPNLEYSHEIAGIAKFWREGYDGRNTTVAIIDTGVEPNNEMLKLTTEGKLKIVDWQDFWKYSGEPSEGDVMLSEYAVLTNENANYIEVDGLKVSVPSDIQGKVLYGYFAEENLIYNYGQNQHDVNNNGRYDDKIGVLVSNYDDIDKANDEILVDTDLDYKFTDEKQMGIYKEIASKIKDEVIFEMIDGMPVINNNEPVIIETYREEYDKLVNNFYDFKTGYNASGTKYNFTITSVDNREGTWYVNLGYDGNGHGTHVAGDAAGNGYIKLPFVDTELLDDEGEQISDGTLKGAAPGAQIIACRVFASDGGTPQSAYLAASEYACEQGAEVINMSLGGLPDLNDESAPECEFINRLSKEYGVIFCISAGNDGPFTNSVGTPGAAEWPITVGAYNPSWINYGNHNVKDVLWYFSSRGPTEDGRLKPTLIAPGSMISSAPMWLVNNIRSTEIGGGVYTGYALEQGTSMASPYAAGVVAAIVQAMKEKSLPYHPLVVKEALFETGVKELDGLNYKPMEIGGGMINPSEALKYLENLKASGLEQQDLSIDSKYIDRSSINVSTEVQYSEKLNYNPEGLYIRNGEIPERIQAVISNLTNQDVNIHLEKDSYNFSNEWLTINEENLSIKKGESKVIELKIDREKLDYGINSVLLKMDDPNTVLKEGFMPITVVNYMELDTNNSQQTQVYEEGVRPGGTASHFIRIPYGTDKVEVEIELLEAGDSSNLLPIIAAPSGLEESAIPGADWIDGFTRVRKISILDPEPGTWEISLYSGLVENVSGAKGKHKITTSLKGMNFGPSVIKYSGKSGEYKDNKINVNLLNATTTETQKVFLRTTNLVWEDANKEVVRKNLKNQEVQSAFRFIIPQNDRNIFANLKTRNPEFSSDDIDIALYKVIKNKDGSERLGELIAESGNVDSDENIYVETLKPGEYELVVVAYDTAPNTSYDLIYQIANNSSGENVIKLENSSLEVNRELANFNVGVRVPTKQGRYLGFIYAQDIEGNLLGRARLEAVSTGTDNSLVLQGDDLTRVGNDLSMNLVGDIKDSSKLNNIYGVQFEIELDNFINAEDIDDGEVFKGTDTIILNKEVKDNKIQYAACFLNASGDSDATGAISGNLAILKLNAKETGVSSIKFNKLLLVNHLGDDIAMDMQVNKELVIAQPDIIYDGIVNIQDIAKLAYRIGKCNGDNGYESYLDFNKDDVLDYKDLDFIVECFTEDNN